MPFDLIETLARLVAIPSVNPMGRPESGPPYGEAALTDHLERLFQGLGLRTHRQPVAPGRDNLVARLDGEVPPEQGGPLILFDAHQDTVPVDNMTIEPWTPAVRDGRLHGRGACDTKGGMAAMIAVIARLAAERPPGMPSLVMTCTVDEEYSFSGVSALVADWRAASGGLIPRPPDAAVVAEPTGLNVVVAHKGVVRWRCHTHGRAAHGAQPEAGDNALYKMARVLTALERYQRELAAGPAGEMRSPWSGPFFGHKALLAGYTVARKHGPDPFACTINVGTIRGGASVNIVPERCTIEIDLRFPPGMTPENARGRLIDYLVRQVHLDPPPSHDPPYMQGPALSDEASAAVTERLMAATCQVMGDCRRQAVPYATNAAFFAQAGTPAVVFGPGSVAQAHTADEWLPLDELRHAAEILYRFSN
jgi:acetylornithine deacetylase/succinyl-diaminopimelate desuccinylase-like protein